MKNKMIEAINVALKEAKEQFNGEWTEAHSQRMARIYGMIDMLCIYTGEQYKINTSTDTLEIA